MKFIIRTQSDFPHTYGVGEQVIPGVFLFRAGEYNLTKSEVQKLLFKKQRSGK